MTSTGRSILSLVEPLRRLSVLIVHFDTRATRFLLVGITGVGVSSVVLWVATSKVGISTVWAGLIAGATATFTNFLLNDAFTWRDRRSPSIRLKAIRLVRYYSTTAGGNLIYLGVLTALTQWLGLFVLLANVVAIGVGGTFNYLLHNVWTWRR